MNIQATIPAVIWDQKRFKWKVYMKGTFESLSGCPNWLYEAIRQLQSSGAVDKDAISVMTSNGYHYAVKFNDDNIVIFSKKEARR